MISLDTVPAENVGIDVTTTTSACSLADSTITLTPGQISQTVTVFGIDDLMFADDQACGVTTAISESNDLDYDGINPDDVTVNVLDVTVAGVSVFPTSGLVTDEDGGSDTFEIVLTAIPAKDVTIGISNSDPGEGVPSSSMVTFTPGNALMSQTITVTGVADGVIDPDTAYQIITAASSSGDGNFAGLAAAKQRMDIHISLSILIGGGVRHQMRMLGFFTTLLMTACSSVQPAIDLSYWAESGAENHKGFVTKRSHHACSGEVVSFSASRIPLLGEYKGVVPERVLEVDDSGIIRRQWSIPIDTFVVAVDGAQVLVPYVYERALAISEDGSFVVVEYPEFSPPKHEPVECPEAVKAEFPGSGYLRCHGYTDLSDQTLRLLAYEGPCT